VVRRKLSEKADNQFQFRMEPDLLERYVLILRRVEKRNMLASEAEVNKRLAGVMPADKLVTTEDVQYFRGAAAEGAAGVPVRRGEPQGGTKKTGKKKQVNGDDA
jgi:hypothetical protein